MSNGFCQPLSEKINDMVPSAVNIFLLPVVRWWSPKLEYSNVTMSHFAYSGNMMKMISGKIAVNEYAELDDIFPQAKPVVRKDRFQGRVDR